MLKRRIDIGEYEGDIRKLLERRLSQTTVDFSVMPYETGMVVELRAADALDDLCKALALLLCRDLCHFELAQLTDKLPLSLVEKQAVLAHSVYCARRVERMGKVKRGLKTYLENTEALHLSGYMRFRMSDTMNLWRLCVQSAMEELQLEKEYFELMGVLHAFVEAKPTRVREVSLLLNPDGSCTLTDDSDARIDYRECDPDRLVSVLVDLAPERLTVYDFGKEANGLLIEMLRRVFADRVRVID